MIATICCIVQEAMVIYSFCVNREETIMHDRIAVLYPVGVEVLGSSGSKHRGEPRGIDSKSPGGARTHSR
jgi:hypothetical protein